MVRQAHHEPEGSAFTVRPKLVEGPTIGSNVVIKWSLVLIPGIPVSDRQEQYQRRADNHRAFDECDSHVAFN